MSSPTPSPFWLFRHPPTAKSLVLELLNQVQVGATKTITELTMTTAALCYRLNRHSHARRLCSCEAWSRSLHLDDIYLLLWPPLLLSPFFLPLRFLSRPILVQSSCTQRHGTNRSDLLQRCSHPLFRQDGYRGSHIPRTATRT